MLASAHALIPLGVRARLDLACERAWGHRALAVGEVEDAPREHLDLALPIARVRVLVRVRLRAVRVWRATERGGRGRCPCLGKHADVLNEQVRAPDVTDELWVCKQVSCGDDRLNAKMVVPPDSSNCTIVQTAICWKVASGLVRNLYRYLCIPPSGASHTSLNAE